MCLTAFAYQLIDKQPLLLIANRDEFYHRPTKALHPWQNSSGIIAPQDLISGGSFIGHNKHGQWIVITNVRQGNDNSTKQSRGDIFKLYLQQNINADAFSNQLVTIAQRFNPFNALIGDRHQLFYVSSQFQNREKISPGLYGLSNAALDTPWPKLITLKENLKSTISAPFSDKQLWKLLKDNKQANIAQLPNTGITKSREKLLSSIFIESEDYGTRSSYILSQADRLTLHEKIYH